jgi:predicted nucleic acid-binding protein
MIKKVVLDTNILVYSINSADKLHVKTLSLMESLVDQNVEILIPDKALFEFGRVLSSKAFSKIVSSQQSFEIWNSFAFNPAFKIIYFSNSTLKILKKLMAKYSTKHIFDLVILAMAMENKADILYTQNTKDFPRTEDIKITPID